MRFTPFITVGRFYKKDGRVLVPVTGSFHHAVNDGYHAKFRSAAGKYHKGVCKINDR